MAELCRMFGVSRQTGYTWVKRFRAADNELDARAERSRRPKSSPRAAYPELEDLIVAARKLSPRWGPRKLRARLVESKTAGSSGFIERSRWQQRFSARDPTIATAPPAHHGLWHLTVELALSRRKPPPRGTERVSP